MVTHIGQKRPLTGNVLGSLTYILAVRTTELRDGERLA